MQYGRMSEDPGVYILNKIPEAGNFEYIYKNKKVVLKTDQYGPSFIQMDPPSGMFVVQRKERETFSPIKYYLSDGRRTVHNFDIFQAKKFEIRFFPEKCEYELEFSSIRSLTTIMLDSDKEIIYFSLKVTSKTNENIKVLSAACFDPVDTSMAVWDKKEWYSVTEADGLISPLFITRHYSVNGNKDDRRNIIFLTNKDALSIQNSPERLRYFTKNYSVLPNSISSKELEPLVCYEQIAALRFDIRSGETINSLIKVTDDSVDLNKNELLEKLCESNLEKIENKAKLTYDSLIKRRMIETPDSEFNNFVNNYLPLELSWVTDLDRGWPTGMRGSRDCANDFLGYLAYDLGKCKEIIKSLFDNERYEDGWFPRQIPSNGSNKYDLRPFSDSGAFVIELIYEYLSYSNDFGLLDEMFSYYGSDRAGTGLEHLIKAAKYYTLGENIGEHSLIKLHGGDWLDCLNRVGLKGRGESMMVTCQAILAFRQVTEVLNRYGSEYADDIKLFNQMSKKYRKAIKDNCYLEDDGFYRALFSDDGNWYFSNKDLDGNKRVYIPTNAYSIISGIDPKKDKLVIKTINELNESRNGFKLFTVPFGNPPFEGIGKMGTGDFYPYMFENGAVYNHGGNLFYARALSVAKDHKTFYRALNYALPYNPKFHPESVSYLPSYACTNAYNLVPSFTGRSGMCFLTGSISMIERAVYNWLFGLDYHMNHLEINPCIPKEYSNSSVTETYDGHKINIKYIGYGSKPVKVMVNGNELPLTDKKVIIDKALINEDSLIIIELKA